MSITTEIVHTVRRSFSAVDSSDFYEAQIASHRQLLERLFAERQKNNADASRMDFNEYLRNQASEQLFGAIITLDCLDRETANEPAV